MMENYIEEDDLVILGNRTEAQLCAIEMKAGCIIVGWARRFPGRSSDWRRKEVCASSARPTTRIPSPV